MLYAQKANVVTRINEADADKYVANGYKVIDESGRIVKDTAPDNLTDLKNAYISNVAEINTLKGEIERLKAELTRANEIVKAKSSASSEDKPKQTRAKRTTTKAE